MSDEMKAGEDKADIVTRLNAACIGHPHARIPWPHRLLHDARARIEELQTLLAEGLDLCVRARKLDEPVAGLDDQRTPMTRSATPHLWVLDQYDRDLAAWEKRARKALS